MGGFEAVECFDLAILVMKDHETGATEGFTMADGRGLTPINVASKNGHLSVCKLLIFNGALNETNSQHVRENIVFRDFKNASLSLILKLFTWLEDIINCQNNFLIVLNASVLIPNSHKKISKKRCRLPLLNRNNLLQFLLRLLLIN